MLHSLYISLSPPSACLSWDGWWWGPPACWPLDQAYLYWILTGPEKKAGEVGKVDVEVVGTDVKTYRSISLREGTEGAQRCTWWLTSGGAGVPRTSTSDRPACMNKSTTTYSQGVDIKMGMGRSGLGLRPGIVALRPILRAMDRLIFPICYGLDGPSYQVLESLSISLLLSCTSPTFKSCPLY